MRLVLAPRETWVGAIFGKVCPAVMLLDLSTRVIDLISLW